MQPVQDSNKHDPGNDLLKQSSNRGKNGHPIWIPNKAVAENTGLNNSMSRKLKSKIVMPFMIFPNLSKNCLSSK